MKSQIAIVNFKKQNYKHEVDCEETIFGDTDYSYMTDIADLKEGDVVVVETKWGLELAKFVHYSILPSQAELAKRWIVEKVDLKAHKARVKKLQEKETLLSEMRKLRDSSMELELFSNLAKLNPQMAELFDKFNKL